MIGTRVAFRGAFGPNEGVVLEGAAPEVTCAPSAQGMQALPMVLVVPSPILECDPGPGAFIAETLRCPGQVKRLVSCAACHSFVASVTRECCKSNSISNS